MLVHVCSIASTYFIGIVTCSPYGVYKFDRCNSWCLQVETPLLREVSFPFSSSKRVSSSCFSSCSRCPSAARRGRTTVFLLVRLLGV